MKRQHDAIAGLVDEIYADLRRGGIEALFYDFSPVPFSAEEGVFCLPTHIEARGIPDEMLTDWCEHGLYRLDPVQRCASRITRPFYWTYHPGEPSMITPELVADGADQVSEKLMAWGLARGITVPIHLPGGGFATATGFLGGSEPSRSILAQFAYVAHELQDRIAPMLEPAVPRLSPRERECVQMTGKGLSAKQIAFELGRSESMVVKHLQSAARKLGARNRSHSVALAARYGYLH